MIVIWSRLGFLVLPILILSLVGTQSLVDWKFGKGFYTATLWPKVTASLVAALATGLVGYFLNRKEPTWATKHRLFFLPMEYWAFIILLITGFLAYGNLTTH